MKLRLAGVGLALMAGCGSDDGVNTAEWRCRLGFEKARTARDSLKIVTEGITVENGTDAFASTCASLMARDQLSARANAQQKAGR